MAADDTIARYVGQATSEGDTVKCGVCLDRGPAAPADPSKQYLIGWPFCPGCGREPTRRGA
jgi:hypothetical protein